MKDPNVKTTNIEVCVRVRPLLMKPSLKDEKFLSSPGSSPTSNRGRLPPSRLAPPSSRLPIRKPELPGHGEAPENKPTRHEAAWDVLGNDTLEQSAMTDRVQGRTIRYTLDRVYGPQSSTLELYQQSVQPVVLSTLEGYHASVFAYGQTSTGKTFTMIGTQTSPGIVPLAVQDVFDYIQQGDEAAREYLVRFSYLEIYNEQIIDLLSDTTTSIRILEGKEGVVVRGLREEVVTSPEEIFFLLQKGELRRQVGSTNMNKHSSRSHAIVRLWLESKSSDTSGTTRVSSLSLVDLAGSESVRLTGSTGERQREGQYINKSLMTLGQVIHKLSENQERAHIPYRDSKLTRLMQSSLSGNAQVVCVCNISSSSAHLEESHNTLKFATRAKKIEQRVKINEVQDQNTLLQEYKEEIEELKQQLAEAKKAQQQQKNEEDVRELISAIHKMEKLILKTQKFQVKKPQVEDDMLLLLSPDSMDAEDLLSTSPEVTTKPSALTNGHAGEPTGLFEEMHRIQGLLDNVLSKRGIPSATKARDDEVKELKSQLHEQEVATTLKKADANFLQHQLQEKDKLLEEVSKILEAVEKRQVELEAQNKNLKRLVIERDRQIAIKQHRIIDCERELVELKSKLSVVM